jgi:hypothetical protein
VRCITFAGTASLIRHVLRGFRAAVGGIFLANARTVQLLLDMQFSSYVAPLLADLKARRILHPFGSRPR